MKSMKQVADELNVTKMTVYNNATKLNIKFNKVNNVNYLSTEDEDIITKQIQKNKKSMMILAKRMKKKIKLIVVIG